MKESSFLMGTVVEITVEHEDRMLAKKVIQDAFHEGERIEKLLSGFKKDSEVSRINLKAGIERVNVSEDFLYVIGKVLYYSGLSGGAFDITVGPLLDLWGFCGGERRIPGEAEIREVMPLVNYRNVNVNREGGIVKLEKRGMKIDLGGIAKGYVVDRMVGILKSGGINRAIVNAGGDIYALGSPAGESGWKVGVRDPRNHDSVVRVLSVSDRAVATSGDYEKFFFKDGKRYSHIIDPRIGVPASGVVSVTVIAKTATEADALATTLFVLGEEDGEKLIRKLESVEALFLF